jgi:hypothetical protein
VEFSKSVRQFLESEEISGTIQFVGRDTAESLQALLVKVKLLCTSLIRHYCLKMYAEVGGRHHGSTFSPLGNTTGYALCIRGWMDPRSGLDPTENRNIS